MDSSLKQIQNRYHKQKQVCANTADHKEMLSNVDKYIS